MWQVYLDLITIAALAIVGVAAWRWARAQRRDLARLRHDLCAEFAVFVRKLSDPDAVAAYVRTHVDQPSAELLASALGSEGYQRYLVGLHARFTR